MTTEEELLKLLQALNPENIAQQDAQYDQRSALLRAELAKAQGLADQQGPSYRTPGGAALGGLASVLRGVAGGIQGRQAREGLQQLGAEREAGQKLRDIDRVRILKRALAAQAGAGNSPPGEGPPLDATGAAAPAGGAPGGSRINPVSPAARGPLTAPPDAMNELFQSSPQQKQALMAQMLRADPRVMAQMLAASGDPMLGKLGAMQLQGINQSAARQQKLGDVADERQYQRQRDAAQNAAAERRARIMAQGELDREARADARTEARESRTDMTKREAQARDIEERYRNMTTALDQLEKLVADKGTYEVMGPHNAQLEGLITSYATDAAKLRDPTSVAREGEVELEKRALFSPGLGTKNSTALELIRNAREQVKKRRDEAYRVRGLQAPAAPTSASGKSVSADDLNSLFGAK